MKVFWAPLIVPGTGPDEQLSMLAVAEQASRYGFARIEVGYNATDQARNLITLGFIEYSESPDDVLIMLDADHVYPTDILQRLAGHTRPVVGALYFGRRPPYEPMFFHRRGNKLDRAYKWSKPGEECTVVGTAAIAIRRDTFTLLKEKGFEYPWFRYEYTDEARHRPSEDMYFGKICEKAGIPHYVDTTLRIPHMMPLGITEEMYKAHKARAK